jgi:thiamine-phosphate pyrophosphorylase
MNHHELLAALEQADLYVVITESFCAGRSSLEVLEKTLAAGVRLVQMREKEMDGRSLYKLALQYRRLTREAGALFIVDDRLDIALAVEADGVHLGQEDVPVQAARRIAPELIIGASTHSREEALEAQEAGASYVNIGPIFPTQTKDVVPLGVEAIDLIVPHLYIPWTNMGGIKAANITQLVARQARHPAVMTAVTAAPDVTGAARELRQLISPGVK